jgi:hypothetical protein
MNELMRKSLSKIHETMNSQEEGGRMTTFIVTRLMKIIANQGRRFPRRWEKRPLVQQTT